MKSVHHTQRPCWKNWSGESSRFQKQDFPTIATVDGIQCNQWRNAESTWAYEWRPLAHSSAWVLFLPKDVLSHLAVVQRATAFRDPLKCAKAVVKSWFKMFKMRLLWKLSHHWCAGTASWWASTNISKTNGPNAWPSKAKWWLSKGFRNWMSLKVLALQRKRPEFNRLKGRHHSTSKKYT